MISANELRKGMMIRMDGDLCAVLSYQHVKPGKGPAFVRVKIRSLRKNSTVEKTLRPDEKVEDVYIDRRKMQYLYSDGESAVFMDLESYEQESVPLENVAGERKFLKEGLEVDVSYYEHEIISIDLPIFVELKITHAEPGLRGDTATTTFKTAEVETGSTIQVPLFINEGDAIKVDTRSGEYMERV
ncbi:MAG: elongation factor P [Spirochaetes bacterium]|nr:elongation factor P [Spirochaetota bacterium]